MFHALHDTFDGQDGNCIAASTYVSIPIAVVVQEPVVRTQSSPRAEQLAKRLKDAGAHMYGAFWCSHCQEQKAMFGKQAQADLPYVECFPQGWHKVGSIVGTD